MGRAMEKKSGREIKTGEGGAKIRQREDGAVFISPLVLIFLFSGSFPCEIKKQKEGQ